MGNKIFTVEPAELQCIACDKIVPEDEVAWEVTEAAGTIVCIDCAGPMDEVDRRKVCTGCRKSYTPIIDDDGDCCPSCARY